jgi:hypothetical protein
LCPPGINIYIRLVHIFDRRQRHATKRPPNMDRALENANPTILSLADLPTRRREQAAKSKRDPGFESILLPYKNEDWISCFDLSDWVDSDEDVGIPEPIDEQEIFGMFWQDLAWTPDALDCAAQSSHVASKAPVMSTDSATRHFFRFTMLR